MAGYYFNLPSIDQLTIPQQSLLFETNQIALSGGPGTGKSVVSLWRHISNCNQNKHSLLLTYTTTLARYLRACCVTQNSAAANNVGTSMRTLPKIGAGWDEIIIDEAQDLPIADLQDNYDGCLLLSSHFGTQKTDCCLEIVLVEQETGELVDVKNGFFLFKKPLPITRVKKSISPVTRKNNK